ncbi:hypothetical protein CHARACLAT_024976, partial [Characodon lateralis]|nr:hypothetical protein [Characodon lateralis]
WVVGKLVPISSSLWVGGGVHPGQVASPSQGNTQTTIHTLIHTPKGNLERPINLTGMSLDCGRRPRTEDPSAEDEKRRNYGGVYVGLPADPTTVAASQSKSTRKD